MLIPVAREFRIMGATAPTSRDDGFKDALKPVPDEKPRIRSGVAHRSHSTGKINKFSWEQRDENSCAAAAALVAGWELGLISPNMSSREAKTAERDLYRKMRELSDAPPRRGAEPVGVARAAETAGASTAISLSENPMMRKHKRMMMRLARAAGIPVRTRKPMARSRDNTTRKIMMVEVKSHDGVNGLHWLLKRPDDSVMDPRDGSNHPSLGQLNRAIAERGRHYEAVGATIELKRPG